MRAITCPVVTDAPRLDVELAYDSGHRGHDDDVRTAVVDHRDRILFGDHLALVDDHLGDGAADRAAHVVHVCSWSGYPVSTVSPWCSSR